MGIDHLGLMPAPASPLGIFNPAFDPTAHAVPDGGGLCWCQIGHDQPHLLIALIPACQERTLQAAGLLGEAVHLATPGAAQGGCSGGQTPKLPPPFPTGIPPLARSRSRFRAQPTALA